MLNFKHVLRLLSIIFHFFALFFLCAYIKYNIIAVMLPLMVAHKHICLKYKIQKSGQFDADFDLTIQSLIVLVVHTLPITSSVFLSIYLNPKNHFQRRNVGESIASMEKDCHLALDKGNKKYEL